MTKMQAGKDELREYLRHAGMDAVKEVEDTDRKRVLGVLTRRQEDGLDLLDHVRARVDLPQGTAAGGTRRTPADWLAGPLLPLALSFCVAAFAFVALLSPRPAGTEAASTREWVYVLLFALLILGQSVFRLVRSRGEKSPARPAAEALPDTEGAKLFLDRQLSKARTDAESICGMFQYRQLESANAYEEELVKLFTSLYEARVDRPDCEEMNYSLTMAEMMLRQIGLKTVPYSRAQESLFIVETEDYPDQMRFPAVVREKTGEVVRKGEYIRNRAGTK